MSKRYLKKLVDEGFVEGWSDPRMPTLSGMRERGYPAEAIREFCERVGVAKANSEVNTAMLEFCVRENLNANVLNDIRIPKSYSATNNKPFILRWRVNHKVITLNKQLIAESNFVINYSQHLHFGI